MKNGCPRILLTAPASGSGKTLITCGILQALVNRHLRTASFKCGPDYIDPMFHSRVIGTRSKNLDTFFTDPDTTRFIFGSTASDYDISVIEGVMGYYDGLGGRSLTSSSYELSQTLDAPVILIVDCHGAATTVAAVVKGMKEFRSNNIRGVILNRMSKGIYGSVKDLIESEVDVKVIGYVPNMKDMVLESRHLGLVLPDEIASLKKDLMKLADRLEETLDIDSLVAMASAAPALEYSRPDIPSVKGGARIAVADDDAFCFTYEDNLELLRMMGAEIVRFSPIRDERLPKNVDGLILSGGYPELHSAELSSNSEMLKDIRDAIAGGMPCIAECGGFMYLNKELEASDGKFYGMVGSLGGRCTRTDRLVRFGYISLTAKDDQLLLAKGESVKGHEFHYWDCSDNRGDCTATKAFGGEKYDCVAANGTLYAGFPHIYFYSNPDTAYRFLSKCRGYADGRDFNCRP